MIDFFSLPSLGKPVAFLQQLLLISIVWFAIRRLFVWGRCKLRSDLHAIPGPSILEWHQAAIGYSQSYHMLCLDPFAVSTILNQWRKKYGPIYQLRTALGERVIMISSDSAMRTVNITKSANFEKNPLTKKFIGPLVGKDGILLAEGSAHTRLRKAVSPAMHHESLVALESAFLAEGAALAERLALLGNNCENLLFEIRRSSFAVIFETCFGKEVAQSDRVAKLQKAYHEVFEEPMWRTFLGSVLQTIFWFADPNLFNWRKDLNRYISQTTHELCIEHFQNRYNKSPSFQCHLLSLMVDADTQKNISTKEMVETVLSFLTAGQLTTSLAVCWTLFILAKEPKWQEQLVAELNSWSVEDGLSALDSFPLMDRIVKESIRMYPPLCYITRICVKTTDIDGYRVPEGITVRMPIAAMHRDEDIWGSDAHKFNPDRFLSDDLVARTRMFWSPFLFGPRSCIGQRFALLQIKAFVGQVVAKHSVYLKDLRHGVPACSCGSIAVPSEMKIYFRSRQ